MDWSYFETAHGKGAVDGIGGTVKRVVWLAVLRDKVVVSSPKEFADTAAKLCDKINILFVSSDEVHSLTEHCKIRWEKCKAVPETHKLHFVKPLQSGTIATAVNTTFIPDEQANMKQFKVTLNMPTQIQTLSNTKDQEEPDKDVPSTSDETHVTVDTEAIDLKCGYFVIANIDVEGKQQTRTFVGQILGENPLLIKYMKKCSTSSDKKFSFKSDKEYTIDRKAVVKVLEVPSVNSREVYTFPYDIQVTE